MGNNEKFKNKAVKRRSNRIQAHKQSATLSTVGASLAQVGCVVFTIILVILVMFKVLQKLEEVEDAMVILNGEPQAEQ